MDSVEQRIEHSESTSQCFHFSTQALASQSPALVLLPYPTAVRPNAPRVCQAFSCGFDHLCYERNSDFLQINLHHHIEVDLNNLLFNSSKIHVSLKSR